MGVGEHTNDCKISRLCVAIVNLRNRMGKEKKKGGKPFVTSVTIIFPSVLLRTLTDIFARF